MAYSSIAKPTDYFNTNLWTGTGDSTTAVTGVGFQPDWVWVKNRDVGDDHMLFDAVRGVTKRLFSNSTTAEGTDAQTLTSFDSDGFTTGNNRATGGDSGNKMVAWNWLAANGTASNSNGSITSTVSANTTAGFSIVSWTGTGDGTPSSSGTLGHGLSSAPKMIIVKNRTDAVNWPVYHAGNTSAPETEVIYLNLTNTTSDDNNFWNDTAPTSSVFTVAGDNSVNGNGDSMIAYCFADVKGYSKFDSYTGNGNADGTFVYTGFKPAWVMVKRTDSATNANWAISDNQRLNNSGNQDGGKGNYVPHVLAANLHNDESYFGGGAGNKQDFLSNGFKFRDTGSYGNASGSTYIYMAFAENPFVGNDSGTAVPVVAR
jgi:hypothetical protein